MPLVDQPLEPGPDPASEARVQHRMGSTRAMPVLLVRLRRPGHPRPFLDGRDQPYGLRGQGAPAALAPLLMTQSNPSKVQGVG